MFRYHTDREHVTIEEQVKILQRGEAVTKLPDSFEKLGSNYCSLGQTRKYYDQLFERGFGIYSEVLQGLNDVIFNRLGGAFSSEPGFEESLRDVELSSRE